MQSPSAEPRLTADEYLGAAPDAFGDIEVVDGLVVHNMAQSEVHDLVVRRLAAALENARPGDGPCFRISSDVAVRFADAASSRADHRLNVRYPDVMVRDCDPYDRLDWSGRRYVVQAVHRRALILDEPFRLTATFEDLQRP